jgi:UDPglucose 6-dehydrogenase
LVTEWNEFKQLDMRRLRAGMAFPLLVDGRNVHDPASMTALGFIYIGVGRGQAVHYPPGYTNAAAGTRTLVAAAR